MIHTLVQFRGLLNDDLKAHISNFLEICDTFKHNRVTDDAIHLILFLFSLRDKAKVWLYSLPTRFIMTLDELAQKFLAKFFPTKTTKMRNDITSFMQLNARLLYEAWERYKDLLHGLPKWL
ncbi:Uncharacterized protein TCM_010153 [Theobroma cacao]|uniref:Retrotransposon gag domain-containing protein n=1 Tax=Theobroma cacao TaxID=3641 RepID=A0A061E5R9_THECC|nr:Uncharacterized protein TCM_010153 [Theobroma cacao]